MIVKEYDCDCIHILSTQEEKKHGLQRADHIYGFVPGGETFAARSLAYRMKDSDGTEHWQEVKPEYCPVCGKKLNTTIERK